MKSIIYVYQLYPIISLSSIEKLYSILVFFNVKGILKGYSRSLNDGTRLVGHRHAERRRLEQEALRAWGATAQRVSRAITTAEARGKTSDAVLFRKGIENIIE